MAKICKEKLTIEGTSAKRAGAPVELDLYYDARNHFFYFQRNDLVAALKLKTVPPDNVYWDCDSREKCLSMTRLLFEEGAVKKRFIQVELAIPDRLYKVKVDGYGDYEQYSSRDERLKEDLPPFIEPMLRGTNYHVGFELRVTRYIRHSREDVVLWEERKRDWSAYSNPGYNRDDGRVRLEWSQTIEDFFEKMYKQSDELAQKILDFFAAPSKQDLEERIAMMQYDKLLERPFDL